MEYIPSVIRVIVQRGQGDCAIASLAMYLDVLYEDVLDATARVTHQGHRRGLYVKQMLATAAALGKPMVAKRRWDTETASGVLTLTKRKGHRGPAHAAVLHWGLIFDPMDGACWEPDVYYADSHYRATSLLTRR